MNDKELEIISNSVDRTIEIGRVLGKALTGSEVIALIGPLGSGKTHFIKGLAQGLEVTNTEATSPTFTLINEYEGRLPLYHVDAYRLENGRQLEALGFDEICESGAVTVIEWADRVWQLVETYHPMCVHLEHRGGGRGGENERSIRLKNLPGYIKERLAESFSIN